MTDTVFDFAAIETTESDPEPTMTSTPERICQADGCAKPTTPYGGKGPRPKYCAEHKRKSGPTTTRKKKSYGTDYTEGVADLLSMPAAVLGVVGSQTNNIPLVADAAVIEHYAPKIATAVNDLAQEKPEVAAVLDRVLKAGPYAALIGAVVPMAIQILANHKILPAGIGGTLTAEQVLGMPTAEQVPDDAR